MYCLDDHNGIVDHNGDGKHEGGKRKQVEREAERIEEEECTDQRHGYRNQRNERRTGILQEDVHHDEHEDERLAECLDKVFD